jgi:hypothetical protein
MVEPSAGLNRLSSTRSCHRPSRLQIHTALDAFTKKLALWANRNSRNIDAHVEPVRRRRTAAIPRTNHVLFSLSARENAANCPRGCAAGAALLCSIQENPEQPTRARWLQVESSSRSRSLVEHDLFGKPVSAFPDHALRKLFDAAQVCGTLVRECDCGRPCNGHVPSMCSNSYGSGNRSWNRPWNRR